MIKIIIAIIILFFACNRPVKKGTMAERKGPVTIDHYHDVFWVMNDTTSVSVVVEWHLNRIRVVFKQGSRIDTNYTKRSDKYLQQ